MKWTWLSLNPGRTVFPMRSITLVAGPAKPAASAAAPTKRMRPPATATAWAFGWREFTVQILPLVSIQSAWRGPGEGAETRAVVTVTMMMPMQKKVLALIAVAVARGRARRAGAYFLNRLSQALRA